MDYSKFYTPPTVASILIDEIESSLSPKEIIDICCGSCNLLKAAKARWEDALLYGVDIASHYVDGVEIIQSDGRKFAIEYNKKFSLVLANPPFDFVRESTEFPDLFFGPFEQLEVSRLEIEMLIANLRLLNNDGILLIIMPSSFVEAERYLKIRKILANNYNIVSIIKLPEDTFGVTKINSYAIIINKTKHKSKCASYKILNHCGDTYRFQEKEDIPQKRLSSGLWVSFYDEKYRKRTDIKRGNISSSYFISRGQMILHTSKRKEVWEPTKRYISKKIVPTIFAENGDILVSRIGKSAGQWCVYQGEKAPISDCLYRVKDPDGIIYSKIKDKSELCVCKGVATKYITMQDFENWIYS